MTVNIIPTYDGVTWAVMGVTFIGGIVLAFLGHKWTMAPAEDIRKINAARMHARLSRSLFHPAKYVSINEVLNPNHAVPSESDHKHFYSRTNGEKRLTQNVAIEMSKKSYLTARTTKFQTNYNVVFERYEEDEHHRHLLCQTNLGPRLISSKEQPCMLAFASSDGKWYARCHGFRRSVFDHFGRLRAEEVVTNPKFLKEAIASSVKYECF